jgi:hypothetical protein
MLCPLLGDKTRVTPGSDAKSSNTSLDEVAQVKCQSTLDKIVSTWYRYPNIILVRWDTAAVVQPDNVWETRWNPGRTPEHQSS